MWEGLEMKQVNMLGGCRRRYLCMKQELVAYIYRQRLEVEVM